MIHWRVCKKFSNIQDNKNIWISFDVDDLYESRCYDISPHHIYNRIFNLCLVVSSTNEIPYFSSWSFITYVAMDGNSKLCTFSPIFSTAMWFKFKMSILALHHISLMWMSRTRIWYPSYNINFYKIVRIRRPSDAMRIKEATYAFDKLRRWIDKHPNAYWFMQVVHKIHWSLHGLDHPIRLTPGDLPMQNYIEEQQYNFKKNIYASLVV